MLDALDTTIPDPVRLIDKPFLMPIENVFSIAGRGTVVTGKIEQGIVPTGDAVEIVGLPIKPSVDVVTQVESFGRASSARPGRRQRRLLAAQDGPRRSPARPGARWHGLDDAAPSFEAEVYVLKKEEGGRHTPFFNGYTPQFFFRTTDVTGTAHVLGDAEMADARRRRQAGRVGLRATDRPEHW